MKCKLLSATMLAATTLFIGCISNVKNKTDNTVVKDSLPIESLAFNGIGADTLNSQNTDIQHNKKCVITDQDSIGELIPVRVDRNYGYVSTKGNYKINPQFNLAFSFAKNGLALVRLENYEWAYIDKTGEIVINPHFEDAYGFLENGLALVSDKVNDLYGFIDKRN